MAFVAIGINSSIKNSLSKRTIFRRISMTSWNSEKAMENLQKNPYYEKYAERIAQLQKTSPEEFIRRAEQQQKAKERENRNKFSSVDTRKFSSVLNPKEPKQENTTVEDSKLDKIFKVDLVKDKEASEIQSIWEEYHKNKDVISATIPLPTYIKIQETLKKYPTFLFPLPRSEGYEFIVCQSFGNSAHFTPLLAYQVHKENAPECLTMVHYLELSNKGIVLMRGQFDKNVLNGKEAQCLANQFQMYYNSKDEAKLQLLEKFTKSPDTFKHMDLISQLESIKL